MIQLLLWPQEAPADFSSIILSLYISRVLDVVSLTTSHCKRLLRLIVLLGSRGASKKRESKNSKYGFGGRKRLGKQNDASSAANMESYKSGKRKGKPQRPGKSKRQAMKK